MNSSVYIITLNYNQNIFTLECIRSILQSKYNNFRICLIDNGSEINVFNELKTKIEELQDIRIELHRIEKNRGYVGGINFGLEKGQFNNPDYFLIMNNDTLIDKLAIKELVQTSKDYNDLAIVSGKTYEYNNPKQLQLIGLKLNNAKLLTYDKMGSGEIDTGQYESISERDMLDDIFWLFPYGLYEKIGGYSRYFWFNAEQADFALRAVKIGFKLIYTPHAKLWHKGSVSIGGRNMNPALAYWTIQSQLLLRYLHLPFLSFLYFYFKVIYSIISTYVKSILIFFLKNVNQFRYANAKLNGWVYFNKWLVQKQENSGHNPYLKK